MASGDIVLFNQFKIDLGEKIHDLSSDTFKVGLITSAVTPSAATADPRWGAGGTTNFSTNQVAAGGNYVSGGPTLAANTWTGAGATKTFDGTDISIAQAGANPTNARWGIIYNDTAAGKQAVGYVDLGTNIDLSAGAFAINWNASGIFTLT